MKSAIVGAGAVGAYLAALMTRAGEDVTLIARGATLAAIAEHGVRVESTEGGFEARPVVVESYAAPGPVDVIFLAVKAHSLPAIAPKLAPLVGPETTVVSMQNGIPWWYFEGVERIMDDYSGRPHWGKLHFQSVATLAGRYAQWDRFQAIRDRVDPERRFSNAYLERVLGV